MLFAVKNVALSVPSAKAHAYIANPKNLPDWTNAFANVRDDGGVTLRTPEGEVDIMLETIADSATGVVDWKLNFPDGSVAMANSRVVPLTDDTCAYSFVLTPPPAPLEELEGALEAQTHILEEELQSLKSRLEH